MTLASGFCLRLQRNRSYSFHFAQDQMLHHSFLGHSEDTREVFMMNVVAKVAPYKKWQATVEDDSLC